MKSSTPTQKPLIYRIFIGFLSFLLTLLLIWLLGFIARDIDRMEGPNYETIHKKFVDPNLNQQQEDRLKEKKLLEIQIRDQQEIQKVLRNSRETSQTTMTVLKEFSSLGTSGEVIISEELQKSLTENLNFFLTQQQEFRDAHQKVAEHSEKLRSIEADIRTGTETIERLSKPAIEEFNEAKKKDQYLRATLKLSFLIPLFIIASVWVYKKRGSPYRSIPFACLGATAWKVGAVIHEHFPSEIFKYIAIGVSLAITLAFLLKLINLVIAPKSAWLVKQYRDAYAKGKCPKCSTPILQGVGSPSLGILKGAITLVSNKGISKPEEEAAYTCPCCGQSLFEKCENCNKIRHTLLPYCKSCSVEVESKTETS